MEENSLSPQACQRCWRRKQKVSNLTFQSHCCLRICECSLTRFTPSVTAFYHSVPTVLESTRHAYLEPGDVHRQMLHQTFTMSYNLGEVLALLITSNTHDPQELR